MKKLLSTILALLMILSAFATLASCDKQKDEPETEAKEPQTAVESGDPETDPETDPATDPETKEPEGDKETEKPAESETELAPATRLSHFPVGIRIRFASLCATASAIFGDISPHRESAITIPSGPIMISARLEATTTAFSPVAA